MKRGGERAQKLDTIHNTIASRVGIFALIGLLLSICVGAGVYTNSVVAQLESNHAIFRDRQSRNGYVAMSDIQRLILVTQRAVEAGEMTADLRLEFHDAADIMYVRTDNFQRIMRREHTKIISGEDSIAALLRIVDIADTAIAQGFPDNRQLLETLLNENTKAREHLVQFLDDMRRQAERVLDTQSRAVRKQQLVVIASLAGLTLVGSVALFLLRQEVLARRARERAEQRVEFLAYFDPLTRLPNRAQFQERLHKSLQDRRHLALLYVDLDDFKLINDTCGHSAGDAVLCHVARILSSVAQDNKGFSARLGGDEFALMVPSDDIVKLSRLCERIIAEVADPYWFQGESFRVGVSIGLATTTQVSSKAPTTIDMMSRVADFALYTSKAEGRKCFTVYDQVIEQRFWERRALIEELPRAIEHGDLEVHLQPKVTLPDGQVYGFEALVRWRRDGRLVPPGHLINIAEESGLVVDIDRFVLNQSTRLVSDWNATHGTNFSISVNLSALHFSSPRIGQWVEQALWDAALAPGLLILEVTESTEMRDWKQAREILGDLKNTGCKIAIDDFGTGFSSLAYLKTMDAHELKVDRSLIIELEESDKARLLLASVLEIARNFDLDVIVEGIETEEQANIVHAMGVANAQGFLFGRPLPPEDALSEAMTRVDAQKHARAS